MASFSGRTGASDIGVCEVVNTSRQWSGRVSRSGSSLYFRTPYLDGNTPVAGGNNSGAGAVAYLPSLELDSNNEPAYFWPKSRLKNLKTKASAISTTRRPLPPVWDPILVAANVAVKKA